MIPPVLLSLSDLLLNIKEQIPQLMEIYGIWIYAILFAIIFVRRGLSSHRFSRETPCFFSSVFSLRGKV